MAIEGRPFATKNGVRLLSRNGKDFAHRFPRVIAALGKSLSVGTALDGELVAFDEAGQTRFNRLFLLSLINESGSIGKSLERTRLALQLPALKCSRRN